jgi:uncharacterized membrane protein YeiH
MASQTDTFRLFDLLGVAVFALSGALEARRKQMDVFGVAVVALVTALGGGTLRDLLLYATVFWVADPLPVVVATAVAVFTFFVSRPLVPLSRQMLLVADAAGLALFTVLGVQQAQAGGVSPIVAVLMGMISGVVGGIMRDILCNTIPLVLRREVYATASLAGGLVFLGLGQTPLPLSWRMSFAFLTVFTLRVLALRFHLALPHARGERHNL